MQNVIIQASNVFFIFVIAKHEEWMHTEYIFEGISNAIKLKFILR